MTRPVSGAFPRMPNWPAQLQKLVDRTKDLALYRPEQTFRRLKQWLKMAATFGTFTGFDAIKWAGSVDELFAGLRDHSCLGGRT